jgi:hypothetical protein
MVAACRWRVPRHGRRAAAALCGTPREQAPARVSAHLFGL